MQIDFTDLASERQQVRALLRLENLAIECLRDGRQDLALLMEDHAEDIRTALVRGKQRVTRPLH